MRAEDERVELLESLDLKEYEATALAHLLTAGRSTAPDVAEATGIPKARVYDVLASLGELGYIKVIPGRPKEYQPKSPETVLERAKENRRQAYEDYVGEVESLRVLSYKEEHVGKADEDYVGEVESLREDVLETFGPLFEQADEDVTPTAELFHVVDVGEPSETETRRLYQVAAEAVYVITNSFAYFESVEPAVRDALDREVDVSVLFLDPEHLPAEKAEVQAEIVERIGGEYPGVEFRFSEERLPWRGTFVDPSAEYESGQAIFLTEEPEVPNHRRQAAITENGSFVAGMKRYFDLVWEYESSEGR